SDLVVLLVTFGLTIFVDLTVAVQVGIVAAALLFMKRMADITNIEGVTEEFRDRTDEDPGEITQMRHRKRVLHDREIPPGVEVYEINGPFFFGAADKLKDVLSEIGRTPRVLILRMRHVPAMDATGMHALEQMVKKSRHQGTTVIFSELREQPLRAMRRAGKLEIIGGSENVTKTFEDALDRAIRILDDEPTVRMSRRV
ncbi:MAG TPA: STAS domain-containing protein, partial [Thermoanaerobaculia bacterium]|nr:STAS domain-containing protein [Thermoanaerobaculia bacterium]